MPYKVGAMYCVTAKEEGKVVTVTDKLLKVVYKSGKEHILRLGDTYGKMEGSVYKHRIVTDLKEGQRFDKLEYLSYNTGFFERDWLDSKRLIMKFNKVVTVALSMGDEVYEDSSAISQKLSVEMATQTVKEKVFVIEFDKNIVGLKEEGAAVNVSDSLFTLTDNLTDYANLSESSITLLKNIANLSPKAKMKGSIFRYEMKYNGEIADMSPTLKKLAIKLDAQTQMETSGAPVPLKSNRVTGEYRSEGKNLMPKTLEFKVMIEHKTEQSHGDKGVFAGQMKSVISDVFRANITTASGVPVDAMFSYRSILNRVALSPLLAGTTNRLLRHVSPMIADAYFN